MMKRKRYFIIFLCFVIWGFIFIYVVNYENLRIFKSTTQYILIDPFNYWKYDNLKWEKLDSINEFDNVAKEINWKKYDVYVNNQYYNTLDYVLMNGEEYYFDDDTHSYEIPKQKILFNKGSYFELRNFDLVDFSEEDNNILYNMLNKYHHSSNNLTVQSKYFIDDENFVYIASNYPNYYPQNQDNLFYFVFYRRENKNYLLVDINYIENVSNYKVAWIVNAKSKYDNFILSYTCEEATCYDMYEYQKGKYTKVIGT